MSRDVIKFPIISGCLTAFYLLFGMVANKVILPKANERDVGELSEQVTAGVEIVYVAWYPEVLPHVFPGLEDATALAQRGNQAFVRPPSKVPRREARRPEAAA